MMTNLKYWLKGLAVAAVSMIIYAVALGCYMALMLLVISMEEGGDNLSAFSVPLTEALVLLSQGIGFKTDAITLTIVPLLLTVLLIALIAQLARRFGTSLRGFAAGLVFWEAVNIFFARSINIEIVDSMTMMDPSLYRMDSISCVITGAKDHGHRFRPRAAAGGGVSAGRSDRRCFLGNKQSIIDSEAI